MARAATPETILLEHPDTGERREVALGFCWHMAQFGGFLPIYQREWLAAWVVSLGATFSFGLSNLVFALFYQRYLLKAWLRRGYLVLNTYPGTVDDLSRQLGVPVKAHPRRLAAGPTWEPKPTASVNTPPDTRYSARVVLTTFGTHGDLVPFIGIAKALKALGHRPVIATSDHNKQAIEAHGIEHFAAAPHDSQHNRDTGLTQQQRIQKAFHPLTGGQYVMDTLVYPYMGPICDELAAACEGADLLVAPPTTSWAHLVAARCGLPWKSLIVQSLTLGVHSAQDPSVISNALSLRPFASMLGEQRFHRWFKWMRNQARGVIKPLDAKAREYGVFDKNTHPLFEGVISPRGSIALLAPQMLRSPMPTDLPGRVDFAGFNFFDGNVEPLSQELKDFLDAGPAPVVFSLGSSLWFQAQKFYPHWSALCSKLGVRAIFLAGKDAWPGPLPQGQIAVGWAAVGELFPRCLAVVNPGGCGISSQVLHAGVPQLVVPFGMDQPDNAMRLVRMGAALSVSPAWGKRARFERALRRLVHDPYLHERARALRLEINQTCGTVHAARMLDAELQAMHQGTLSTSHGPIDSPHP
jgi:rhamnosyltransferase subunit B